MNDGVGGQFLGGEQDGRFLLRRQLSRFSGTRCAERLARPFSLCHLFDAIVRRGALPVPALALSRRTERLLHVGKVTSLGEHTPSEVQTEQSIAGSAPCCADGNREGSQEVMISSHTTQGLVCHLWI
jgi:hypothetical protein